MQKVTWGVLSTAKIGWEKAIPAMQKSQHCEVRAIASRDAAKARTLADRLSIVQSYGSYEELLADPAIEAIYNPLPNDAHIALTLAAARAGKHVLCEKPIALSANEAMQLRQVADKVHIMEGFMVRFHPQWLRVLERVRSGELGAIGTVQAFFSYFNRDQNNIRNRAELGGGALYDIGCYPIVIGRFIFECEPLRAIALIDRDTQTGCDRTATAILDFGQGRRLDFTVSTQTASYQRVQLCGSRQRIEVQIPFNAPLGGSTQLLIDNAQALDGSKIVTETIPPCDMYTLQFDAFSQAVRGQLPLPYDAEDAIANMRAIDALFTSEHTKAWVDV